MKALVVEDSRLAREGMLRMLQVYPEIEVIGAAENVEQALEIVDREKPELIFLDINMPRESGFELLELISYEPKIIFTTAHADFAVRSFDYNTVDYLLKPIEQERLTDAIKKLFNTLPGDVEDLKIFSEVLYPDSRIFIRDENRCHLVVVNNIDYIESCKNHIIVYFCGDKAFVKKSLNQAEKRLPERLFFRANRQFIVNLTSVSSVDVSLKESYCLTMKNGKVIEVTRRNSILLKELLSL